MDRSLLGRLVGLASPTTFRMRPKVPTGMAIGSPVSITSCRRADCDPRSCPEMVGDLEHKAVAVIFGAHN